MIKLDWLNPYPTCGRKDEIDSGQTAPGRFFIRCNRCMVSVNDDRKEKVQSEWNEIGHHLRERVKELEAENSRVVNQAREINQLTKNTRANVTMRIIDLETKNDRLCVALKKIADRFDPETQDFEGIIRVAVEALKYQEK